MTNPHWSHGVSSTRRELLLGTAALAAAACTPSASLDPRTPDKLADAPVLTRTITAQDGARIFYKEWGTGQPIVFSHGWPLNADTWDPQLFFFAANGYRAIAYDRRGHGRSDQTWTGNDMNTFADDLSSLMETLELKNAIVVGHSSGAGDVTRYLARHGARRVARGALVSAVPPVMVKTDMNPGGLPQSVFDGVRQAVLADKAQFYKDLAFRFFGANREGSNVSSGVRDEFFIQCMQAGLNAAYDGIKAFSETDFTEDLSKIDVPVLIVHGEDDQNVPIEASAKRSSKLLKHATLTIYAGAPHGLTVTHRDRFNADLLAFVKA